MAIKKLCPFKLWTLQNFPFIAEDFDALTNYELMCKIVEYLNNVINVTNEQTKIIEEIEQYFNTLDIQDEVNKKLDEMAEDGTLEQIIGNYYDKAVLISNNIDTLKDMRLVENSIVKVLNKSGNDNLSAYYKIESSDYTDDSKDIILLNNGLKAVKLNLLSNINETEVHFIYRGVNTGDSILIKGSKNILIDVGTETGINSLINYLVSHNVTKIDYLVITHVHADHIANLDGLQILLQSPNIDFSTCKFIVNTPIDWTQFLGDSTLINQYQQRETAIINMGNLLGGVIYPSTDTKIYLDGNNYLQFYNTSYPTSYYQNTDASGNTDLNNFSLVTELIHDDKKFLFTADIDRLSELNLIDVISKVDVLKVMHHGVNTNDSIDFINKLNPTYAIIMNTDYTRYNAFYTLIRRLNSILYTSNESENVIISTYQNKLLINSTNGYLNFNMGNILQNGDDLNNCVLEGRYRVAIASGQDNGISNSPVGNTINFVLDVELISNDRIYQILKTNEQYPHIYTRNKTGYGWSDWKEINVSAEQSFLRVNYNQAFNVTEDTNNDKTYPINNILVTSHNNTALTLSENKITCKKAGFVEATLMLELNQFTQNDRLYAYIYRNSSVIASCDFQTTQTAAQLIIPPTIISVSANDTIEFRVRNSNGHTINVTNIGQRNYCQVKYIN